MIPAAENDGVITFQLRVVPRASRSEIVGEHDGALRVRIAAPPVDGAANDELVKVLAKAFAVPRNAITIATGQTSKVKTVKQTVSLRDVEFTQPTQTNSLLYKSVVMGQFQF